MIPIRLGFLAVDQGVAVAVVEKKTMPKIPIEKIPLPIPGGPVAKIVISIIGEAVFEALIDEFLDWLKNKRPESADPHPPTPDVESPEFACLEQTYYNTLAIGDVASAIKQHGIVTTVALDNLTTAVSSLETRLGNLIEVLTYTETTTEFKVQSLKAFFDLMKQNSDLELKRQIEMVHLFTGRRPVNIETEEVAFPEIDFQLDARTDGLENRDLDALSEMADPPPAP